MQLQVRSRSRNHAEGLGQQRMGATQALRHNTDRGGVQGLGEKGPLVLPEVTITN